MEFVLIGVLAAAAIAVVAYPLVRESRPVVDETALDAELDAYRAALRNGTLCETCLAANAAGSRFCAECGAALGAADGAAAPAEPPP